MAKGATSNGIAWKSTRKAIPDAISMRAVGNKLKK